MKRLELQSRHYNACDRAEPQQFEPQQLANGKGVHSRAIEAKREGRRAGRPIVALAPPHPKTWPPSGTPTADDTRFLKLSRTFLAKDSTHGGVTLFFKTLFL